MMVVVPLVHSMHSLQRLGERGHFAETRAPVRGLGHLVRRDFLTLRNVQRPVQRTGVLYRARNPKAGLTTRGATYPR
jgi:hypothetical protein